jgi:hypothetical protein
MGARRNAAIERRLRRRTAIRKHHLADVTGANRRSHRANKAPFHPRHFGAIGIQSERGGFIWLSGRAPSWLAKVPADRAVVESRL